jgi:uncharacterized protein (TIGR02996 family)
MSSRKVGPSLQAAATLDGEYQFISAIVSDLRDEGPKLIYADWLEERGDPRSRFVRELVSAARSLSAETKLPKGGSYPRAWTNMLGVPLLKGIIEYDLVDVKDAILSLARPIVTITTKPTKDSLIGVGDSKFGGSPDLPSSTDWPRCERGPLGFLGQIALPDLKRAQVARQLPTDGLLSFFAYQNYISGYQPGVVEGVAGDTCVLYTADPAGLQRREPPDDLGKVGNEILPACRLAFCETWDLPDRDDNLPRKYAVDLKKLRQGERGERLHEVRSDCHPFGHHLLGYSVHFRTSDPSPGPEWPHLLCLDSDDNLGWSWCDGEHLAIFIREKDLQRGNFTRVSGYAS